MIRSLRWRLQVWHAVVLATVLTGFGAIVHALQWQTRLQQVDANLDQSASALSTKLRGLMPRWSRQNFVLVPKNDGGWDFSYAPRDLPNEFPPIDLPAGESLAGRAPALAELPAASAPAESAASDATADDREFPRDRGFRRPWRGGARVPPTGLELPEELEKTFEGPEASRYYVIWDRDGDAKAHSDAAPERSWPELQVGEDRLPIKQARTLNGTREVIIVTPYGWTVLVGQPLAGELAAHQSWGTRLALIGLGVLAVGLLGGSWSAARATRPIRAMTQTASAISAKNLSQRIDVARTDNELGQLGNVLNQAFDRIEAAFQQQARFTADASHELRTPISVILANADFALSRARSEEEYREALESVRRASQRMRSLIESLLTLARFDSGKAALATTSVDLQQLAQETTGLVEPLARQRDITVTIDAAPITVPGDREQLGQVLMNLLTNAIRYNREGGTVRLVVEYRDGAALVSVSDDGIGIPREHLAHVFERFYRVDPARSRNDGGSGLGLSICRTIVEAHGGTISARSSEGAGTTMEVRLPNATAPMPQPAVARGR